MSEARTIPWETIAVWFAKNEQQIRDVMKFEGLRGAVNEVLRLAPDQPEVDAQRLRADTAEAESVASHQREARLQEMVSGLSDLLEEVLNEVPHGWGESFSDSELADRIRAALNQKSEGESQ